MSAEQPCRNPQVMGMFHSDDPAEQRKAAELCFGCPMMLRCASQGKDEEYGVWGGTTEWDRPYAKAAAELRRKAERDEEIREALSSPELTNEAIAERFNASTRTVKRWRARHEIPSTLIAAA